MPYPLLFTDDIGDFGVSRQHFQAIINCLTEIYAVHKLQVTAET